MREATPKKRIESRPWLSTDLALPCRVVDRDCSIVHPDGEQIGMPLREIQAGDTTSGADRVLRVLRVTDLR